ncbi:sulfotransferase domain-containing protein, partial [Microcoleus sp. w2-18aC4]
MFVNDICEQNQKLLKETDVILASYPRSGNTWMRLLLSDIILQSQGFKTQLGGNFIPDIYKEKLDIWNRDPRLKKIPLRIIKSHELYDTRYVNSIYLFRKPADALCSFYYYLLGDPEQREELQKQGIDDFCKVKVEQWRTHVESYIEAKEKKSDNVLFISYENLKEKPEIILRKTTRDFLGLNITSRMCQIAVDNQKFEELQRIQKLEDTSQLGFWEAGGYQNFFRKGKVNSSKDELGQSTIDFIEAKAMAIYNLALSIEKLDFQKESNQGMAMIKDKIEDLVSRGKQSSLAVRLNGVLSNKNEGAVSQVRIHHQKESEQYKLQLQQTQAELAQSQSQMQQTQAELEQSQSQMQQTQEELAQSQSQLQQTQEELQQYQSQLHKTQEVLEQFQDQIQQAETLLQEYQGQLHSTQSELEQSQEQLDATQAVLEQSQEQLDATQAVLEQSQEQLHATKTELAQKTSQLHQTQWELERLRFQTQTTQAELTNSKSQLNRNQQELELAKSQFVQVQAQLERSHSQQHHSKRELKRSHSHLHQVQAELEHSQSQQYQTETVLQQSQSQTNKLERELKRSQSQLHQVQEESQQYQSQLHQVQEESQQYQSQLHQVQEESQQYQSQLHQVQEESQ